MDTLSSSAGGRRRRPQPPAPVQAPAPARAGRLRSLRPTKDPGPGQPCRQRFSRQRPFTTNTATRAQAQHDPDQELLSVNVRLAKHRQALLDANRIERKAFREHARVENAAAAYARELAALLDERGFTQDLLLSEAPTNGEAVLVVQLSDLHFNERVELPSNRYDFTVAAARLAKLAGRIKQLGRSYGATKVVIACLGDFLNSDRRLDELLSNATNRSKATLLAVDILRAGRSCWICAASSSWRSTASPATKAASSRSWAGAMSWPPTATT
jgi:hypothetical protein